MDDHLSNSSSNYNNKSFQIDVSIIQDLDKQHQASELQSLELTVFDVNTLEKGIISQVDSVLNKHVNNCDNTHQDLEEGEISEGDNDYYDYEKKVKQGEMTPFGGTVPDGVTTSSNSRLIKSNDCCTEVERYLKNQANLQTLKQKKLMKKDCDDVKKNNNFNYVTMKEEQERGEELKYSISEKSVKEVKKLKKRKRKRRHDMEQMKNCVKENPCYSGSEYIPSDASISSEEEDELNRRKAAGCRKRKKENKRLTRHEIVETDSDSDWQSSDDDHVFKKRKIKILDDGDINVFTKRMKKCEWNSKASELYTVCGQLKCPLIIWQKLYLYQQVAVKWFWELNEKRCGGILGDEMGLGKTIQVIAFLASLQVSNIQDIELNVKGLGPSIIVCPTTVMHQWVREFREWYPPLRVVILHVSGSYHGKDRSKLIDLIHTYTQGVLITSYTGLVRYQHKILSKQWHYVILDEGHKIRNHSAQVTNVAKQLATPHRLILSGSPLQNNLKELWSLIDFIYPGKLGTLPAFTSRFETPILQGGYVNATQLQVKLAYKFATILKEAITPYLLRRMKCDVDDHIQLPNKTEQVLFCRLTSLQSECYKNYLNQLNIETFAKDKAKMFVALYNMRKICNHPDLFIPSNNINNRSHFQSGNESENEYFGYWAKSGKMIVIETLLKIWKEQEHRVLLFSQTKKMLNILEEFTKRRGYKYLKLDGATCISSRQPIIDKFNKDRSYFMMLLTTKVGGLGINLTGADRVLIYDPDWNPATDTQARERAWRIGQNNPVTVYRLITAGTIEEKIYHRQIFKQFLSNKVLKDPRQRRFFKSNDLIELFTLNETIKQGTNETAAIFAGINSEVKVNSSEIMEQVNNKSTSIKKEKLVKVEFSESKLKEMRELAQKLSKKIVNNQSMMEKFQHINNEKDANDVSDWIYGPDGNLIGGATSKLQPQLNKSNQNYRQKFIPVNNKSDRKEQMVKKIVKKNKKLEKCQKFEGQIVPNLVKCKKIKSNKKKLDKGISQDEYVLHNLFSKSGLETVLKHDVIMEGGPSDYLLVEAEADKVAEEAIRFLKQSSNQPAALKYNFSSHLSKLKKTENNLLLEAIKKRNMIYDSSCEENQLAERMLTWLVGCRGGSATTHQIINEFKDKIDTNKTPIFKSILCKIAKFNRGANNMGLWTLKDRFK